MPLQFTSDCLSPSVPGLLKVTQISIHPQTLFLWLIAYRIDAPQDLAMYKGKPVTLAVSSCAHLNSVSAILNFLWQHTRWSGRLITWNVVKVGVVCAPGGGGGEEFNRASRIGLPHPEAKVKIISALNIWEWTDRIGQKWGNDFFNLNPQRQSTKESMGKT